MCLTNTPYVLYSSLGYYTTFTGRSRGDSSVYMVDLNPTAIAESRACASIPPSLVHNTTYYSTLTVFNSAMNMLNTSVSSDGGNISSFLA